MKKNVRKRGQRFLRKFSRASIKASENSKEHVKENLIERFSHIADIRLLILEWALLVGLLVTLAVTQAFWFGNSYSEDAFAKGGTYTEATIGEVGSMNPLFATTDSEKTLSRLMFATLVTIDYSGHPGMGLAEYVTPNEDYKTWRLKLRDGLKWSDGEPITADDVVFTAELLKNPAVNTIYDSNLAKVEVEKNENDEVVFTLPSTYVDFIVTLNFPIVPQHVLADAEPRTLIENSFSNAPVTSGAFNFNALQATTTEGEKVYYLSANPDYYRGDLMLNSFAIHTYKTKEDVISAINSDAVTATAELSGAEADRITSEQFIIKNSSLNSGAFIFFNTRRDVVENPEMRAAIRQGINIDELRAAAPETMPLDYPLLSSQIELSNYPEIPPHDQEAAKVKISELTGGEPTHIEIATVNSGYLPKVAETLKSQLEALGLEADLITYDENQEFVNNVIAKRSYDILVYDIELGTDPDLIPYYHSSQATTTGLNLSNYKNILADDLLLGARDTLDPTLRVKKYETFLEYWVNGVPAIGLYRPNLTYYYNKNVRPFSNDVRLVTAMDRFSDIDSWAVTRETKNKTP